MLCSILVGPCAPGLVPVRHIVEERQRREFCFSLCRTPCFHRHTNVFRKGLRGLPAANHFEFAKQMCGLQMECYTPFYLSNSLQWYRLDARYWGIIAAKLI